MKSNKEIVLELLRQCTGMAAGEETEGVSTQYLSKRLDMQRTNISAILNALVKEGVVEKRGGRPVLYRVAKNQIKQEEESCFGELVGYEGSLKRSVQLAKAAVLYPQHSLHCLITCLLYTSGDGPGGGRRTSVIFSDRNCDYSIQSACQKTYNDVIRQEKRRYRKWREGAC